VRRAGEQSLSLIIQVILDRTIATEPNLGVSVNGAWPKFNSVETDQFIFPVGIHTHLLPQYRAFDFAFDVACIKEGWNEIIVFNNARFYSLITMGSLANAEERLAHSVRLVSLEAGIFQRDR